MPVASAALISGGVSLLGDLGGFFGGQNTNAMNLQIAQMNNAFNAQQAALNRDFQSSQVSQQENFQMEMSDTAMQRRVADLKAAGLNPLLAIGAGGAQAMSGAAAPGSQASSAGLPTMQNPATAFGNVGAQTTGAMQAAANVNLANATASKTEAETQKLQTVDTGLTQQQIEESRARTGVAQAQAQMLIPAQANAANAQASLSTSQIAVADATAQKIAQELENLKTANSLAQADVIFRRAQSLGQNLSNIQAQYIMPTVIKAAGVNLQLAELRVPEANVMANYFQSVPGKILPYQQQTQSAVDAAGRAFRNFNPFSIGGASGGDSTGALFGNPDTVQGNPNMVR